jgi:large subunit ribosomal protein L13
MSRYKFTGGLSKIRNVVTEGLRYRLVDARGEVVGRLASRLSLLLQGKDKPTFRRDRSDGDVVVVVNAAEATLTGRKLEKKKYYRHTGYVGNLVTRTAKEMMAKEPTFVLRKAVERMLPKNALSRDAMRKLRIFPGPDHAFGDVELVPFEMPPRILRRKSTPPFKLPEGFAPFNPKKHAANERLARRSEDARDALRARREAAIAHAAERERGA